MSYQTGRPAQDEFKLLCSLSGLTCNRSDEDDHGWDFIIEFPPPSDTYQPLDKIAGPRQALVQVKSTQSHLPRTRMKVSNALKLSKSDLPSFVVLFHYDTTGNRRIYVRHFWTDLIRRALRRGRQATADNRQAHDVWMEIGFSDADDHTDAVIDWIVTTIEDTISDYNAKKRHLNETLGYEDRAYRANVTFGPLSGIDELVDHHLGLTDYLPVSNITVVDSRFGIDDPNPLIENSHGRIQVKPNNARDCNLVIQNTAGNLASFKATMRVPAIPNLPADKFKILIQTWCFDLSILPRGNLTVQIRDLWNEPLLLDRLVELSQFLSWGEEPITIKIVGTEFPPMNCRGRFNSSIHVHLFSNLFNVATLVRNIEERSGVSPVSLTLRDLHRSLRELSIFHTILTGHEMQLCADWDPFFQNHIGVSRIITHLDFQVANLTFFAVIDAPTIDRSTEHDGIRLDCGPRCLRDCFVGTDATKIKADGTRSFDREADLHGDECLALGDLRVLLQM